MKKNNIFFFFLLFLFSCVKEKRTYSTTIAVNTTNHKIFCTPYFNGNISYNDTFSLFQNSQKNILGYGNGGISNGLSWGYLQQVMDSVKITFDDIFSIVHYKTSPIGNNPKHYLYSSNRNIFNDSSYKKELLIESSSERNWRFTYTFTEQDYLDAK